MQFFSGMQNNGTYVFSLSFCTWWVHFSAGSCPCKGHVGRHLDPHTVHAACEISGCTSTRFIPQGDWSLHVGLHDVWKCDSLSLLLEKSVVNLSHFSSVLSDLSSWLWWNTVWSTFYLEIPLTTRRPLVGIGTDQGFIICAHNSGPLQLLLLWTWPICNRLLLVKLSHAFYLRILNIFHPVKNQNEDDKIDSNTTNTNTNTNTATIDMEPMNYEIPPPPPPPTSKPPKDANCIHAERRRRALAVDRISRFFFPLTFTFVNVLYWFRFASYL